MARIDLDAVVQLEQPVQAVKEPFGALVGLDGEVWASRVADEQRVAGQEQPGLVGARPVRDGEAAVLRAMAGRVDDAQADVADDDLVAVRDRLERILGLCQRVDRHRQAVLEREPPVPGHVIGVRVRLEDAHDPHVVPGRLLEVLLDRVGGVDDDRFAQRPRHRRDRRRSRDRRRRTAGTTRRGQATGCLGTCRSGYLFCRSVRPGGSPRC